MTKGIDSDAEGRRYAALAEIDNLQSDADTGIVELKRATKLAIYSARRLLLATYAFKTRIFIEHPDAPNITDAPSQSPSEVDQ